MNKEQLRALALIACMCACKLAYAEEDAIHVNEEMDIDKTSLPLINFLRDKGWIKTEHLGDDKYKCVMTPQGWKTFGKAMAAL